MYKRQVQSIAYNWLPGVLKNFSAEYPNITFRLYVDGFQNLTEKLRKKELDCIFVSQYVAKDFQNLPVGTDELVLVTSLDHPLADQLTVSFADIDGQDFVLSADDFDYETGKLFRLNHITPNVRFRINEDYTAIKMVEQGFGITVPVSYTHLDVYKRQELLRTLRLLPDGFQTLPG